MARSTKTQKALNVNVAHGLLSRGVSVTEAAAISARERGFSLRQALPLCGERPYDCACATGWRTVSGGYIQDSARRAGTITRPFSPQRFVHERHCHPRSEEVLDRERSTPPTWLSDLRSFLQFIWSSLSIACSPPSCSKCMDCWLRIALAQ